MRNTWHPLGLKKCVKIATILLSLFLSTTGKSETVNTGNILTNSTFGTGTTYDTTGWTIDEHTHGHNNMAAGGGNLMPDGAAGKTAGECLMQVCQGVGQKQPSGERTVST